MNMLIEIIGVLAASGFSALALYGAIRKDLATAIVTASNAQDTATRAHQRIDALMERKKA